MRGREARHKTNLGCAGAAGVLSMLCLVSCADEEAPPVVPLPENPPSFVNEFGTWGTGDGEFRYPWGIERGADGTLYVCDSLNERIQVLGPGGDYKGQWPVRVAGDDAEVKAPLDVHVEPGGELVVRVLGEGHRRFTPDGTPLGPWGFPNLPAGFAREEDRFFYVSGRHQAGIDPSEVQGPAIWKLDAALGLVERWDYPAGGDSSAYLDGPLARGVDGSLVVLGTKRREPTLFRFEGDGVLLTEWLLDPSVGDRDLAVALDSHGHVLVTGWDAGAVFLFGPDGELIARWHEVAEASKPLEKPIALLVDPRDHVYVVDLFGARVVEYGPLP